VTVVVCDSEPDVAVMVIVDVPVGVPVGGGGVVVPPPPHPVIVIARRRAAVTKIVGANRRWRMRLANAIVLSRIAVSARLHDVNCGGICSARGVDGGIVPRAVVEIESVVVVAVVPGVTVVGLNVAVEAVGNPDAENVIGFGKPPVPGVSVIVYVAVWPAVTVAGDVGALMAKSIPVPASVAV